MKLTEHVSHRPYPLPDGPWVMAQTWNNLLFAHWPVSPELLRKKIPAGLELDTYNGHAYIGVVPFEMSNIHLRGLPPIPFTSAFAELNVRTYVVADGKPGVFFFSLDAANRLAVITARRWFHLPYFHADMSVEVSPHDDIAYKSIRTHRGAPPAIFTGHYRPTSEVYHSEPGTLDSWLTDRYCLYATNRHGDLFRGDIHHLPWPLQHAEAKIVRNTVATSHGIELPSAAPLLHFAKSLDVVIWPLTRVETPQTNTKRLDL